MYSDATNVIYQEQTDLSEMQALKSLDNWAPQVPDEQEIYPNFWSLRGWQCFHVGE